MATIRPFRAVRPRADLASKIAALPYDVYSSEEARNIVRENPWSFLKIDRAETQLEEGVDLYSRRVYQCASDTLQRMIGEGEFVEEQNPCFYIYELTMNGRVQTGIGACASVAEYEQQIIRKHENTRQEKEDDRTRHVDCCKAQTGPIFLTYRYREEIAKLQEKEKKKQPLYDFVSSDGIRHRLWAVKEPEVMRQIQEAFEQVEALYIADGHHRAASAARAAKLRRERGKSKKEAESEYFLSVLFADCELLVMDYNRWVKDLAGQTEAEFLEKLGKTFRLEATESALRPDKKGQFTMYLNHRWYKLEEKEKAERMDVVENLDVSILQSEILHPLLQIGDPKMDPRIGFVGGIRGLSELMRLVDEQGGVAFAVYPTSIEELFAVADEGKLMPPKSTWFEPKLRSGLLIHRI